MKSLVGTLGLLGALALAGPIHGAAPADGVRGGVINLSCMEALVAIEEPGLAGVFSFISEKDAPSAFADFLAHHPKALKKYAAKVDQDLKAAAGVVSWDHEVLMDLLSLFSSPMADTLEKPSSKTMAQMTELSLAPTLSLEAVTAGRKKQ